MHELFTKVLSKRDLSRAGDLFTVSDSEIVNDLTEVVSEYLLSQLNEIKLCNLRSDVCMYLKISVKLFLHWKEMVVSANYFS